MPTNLVTVGDAHMSNHEAGVQVIQGYAGNSKPRNSSTDDGRRPLERL